MTRLACMLLSLVPALAFAQGLYLVPGSNGSSPSASCSFANPTVTGKLTLSGTTGPQIDSTGTGAFELRSRATGTTDGAFRFYANSSVTSGGFLLRIGEKAGTSVENRLTIDHDGTLRLYPDSGFGASIEMFGGIFSTNGGADGPLRIYGGSATTAFTGRLMSVRRAVGDVQVYNIRSDGTVQQAGVATGSLGACNGSAEGGRQYDTTVKAYKYCDGTSWLTETTILAFSGVQDVGSVDAHTCTLFTVSATGVVDGDVAACDPPAALAGSGLTAHCNTGADVIGWDVCNHTAGAIDPASGTYQARVLRP